MRKLYFLLPAIVFLAALAACSDSEEPSQNPPPVDPDPEVYYAAQFRHTDLPSEIGWKGGAYSVTVDYKEMVRSGEEYLPWLMRLLTDGEEGEPMEFTEEEAVFEVTPNLTSAVRTLALQLRGESDWVTVAEAAQDCALTRAGDTEWAKGNLTVAVASDGGENGFTLTDAPFDPGFFFRHMSRYGVPSEGDVYGGTAYMPDAVENDLASIPEGDADPCALVAGGGLRMPTYGELERLLETGYAVETCGGFTGWSFGGGNLFLPLAGACTIETGEIGFRNTNGAYRGSGESVDGQGTLAFGSTEYLFLDYDPGLSLASVRCVRDRVVPTYVSHDPVSASGPEAFSLTVSTDPGEFDSYSVELACSSGGVLKATASGSRPQVEFDIPANEGTEDITYYIMLEGDYTGRTTVQPGVSDYAFYVSHSPLKASHEAFELTVTCDSDMPSFPVAVRSESLELTAYGSSSQPAVTFSVPANSSSEPRTLSIFVNGVDTGRSTVQDGAPQAVGSLSVVWSEGYLTVSDGAYVFAPCDGRGMYFKQRSRYGFGVAPEPPSSSSNYSGTVFGPQPVEMDYADIPSEDTDPCTLVAGGGWRMPTVEECEELLALDYEWEASKWRIYSDGVQSVYLTPSGSVKETGIGMLVTGYVRMWTATPKDESAYYTISGGLSSRTSAFNARIGAKPGVGMMVRCVRDKQ